jgi:hypothetical protein
MLRRLALLFGLIFVFLAAVVVAVAISVSTSPQVVHYRQVVAHDLSSAIHAVRNIIGRYTR